MAGFATFNILINTRWSFELQP